MDAPTRLRVEHLEQPVGLTVERPRLSWWAPAGSRRQLAYRVQAGGWDSGRVESSRGLLVPYDGPALASGETVPWRVKVWTDRGESDWSAPSSWEMGLLRPSDWQVAWIEPDQDEQARPGERPAYLLRGEHHIAKQARRARLYATAHGIYELVLNGTRVGDEELTPGFTAYRTRLQVQAYDVTDLVAVGANVLGALLSDGWYRGKNTAFSHANCYGTRVALLAQLVVEHADGSTTVVGTGSDWRSRVGAVTAADLKDGQASDLRREPEGWQRPGADTSGWGMVSTADHDMTRLTGPLAPPVRRVEEIRPRQVVRLGDGRHVVDLGQNINGRLRLRRLGPEGTTLTITHGETLDGDGDVTTDHLGVVDPDTKEAVPVGQVDRVVSDGQADSVFEPRHTTHGFRYARIEGHDGDLAPDDVVGVVVHSDLRRTGWFRCSDDRLNWLHEAAVWSLRGNACDIPTDCPTRERAGWTGDWQLYVPTASFLFDVAGFSAKWMADLAADQWPDGRVPNIVPDPLVTRSPFFTRITGSSGWGDAAVIVPWEIYQAYGDVAILERHWPTMVAWLDYAARAARSGRHPERAAARPEPAPHEEYLWDTGYHWGEWLEPVDPAQRPAVRSAMLAKYAGGGPDEGAVATAYLHLSSRLMARIASLIGRDDEAPRYKELSARSLEAWQAEYIDEDGRLTLDTQANHVRALAFGLVPDELRPQAADRLVELVRQAGDHVGTGFLATPFLLPLLADLGHTDLAYKVLLQETPPSWLAMRDRGATTIWELWDGIDDQGALKGSLNHYSKGAVVSFLHRYTAGLRPLEGVPAYERFRIEPVPGAGLTSAEVELDSPRGRIECGWRLVGGRYELHATVPPGTSAEVALPDGRREAVGPGPFTTSWAQTS